MAGASETWAEDYLPVDLAGPEPPSSCPEVTDPKIAVLPFDALRWEDFERLLLDVAQAVDELVEARRYGVSGQEQAGIDVVGRGADGSWYAYQAKKVTRLSRAQMRTALDTFVAGRRPFDARRLVVATACKGTRAEVSDLIYDYRTRYPGLEFEQVWDAEHLSSVLRRHPRIVGRYFGDGVAWRFCDADVLSAYRSPDRAMPAVGIALAQADPLTLGVHESIEAPRRAARGSALPMYFRRAFDSLLDDVVECARRGDSAMAILVGNSSTGKSRAAWEAVRGLPGDWRVWHPRSGPEILDERGRIAPRTVIWLDETKDVLLSGDTAADERVAAALGRLVRDPGCAPVLLLGTAWHEHWIRMTLVPGAVDDRKQSRTLLEGCRIDVPEYFSDEELAELLAGPAGRDERWEEAAEHAEDRHVVQYLAGGPAQLRRYELAPPPERAVLDAAIDARRLGNGFRLTEQFLAAAAESALTGLQRDLLADDWFDKVIAYTSAPCRGARGALSRVRRSLLEEAEPAEGLRLADYLEQVVSRRREQLCPAEGFWLAAERFAANARDRVVLVRAALERGRLEAAERLAARAAELGNPRGLVLVAEHLEEEFPDQDALALFARAAESGDGSAQVKLAWRYEKVERIEEAERWYRAAIDGGERSDAVVGLASVLWKQGEHEAAMDLYEEALGNGHARSVEYQARHLAGRGDHELALALTRRSFEEGNTEAFTGLAWRYMYSDHDRAIEVFQHAVEAGDVNALRELAWAMEEDGDREAAEVYCELAVACGEINTLRGLGMIRASAGDTEGARALFWRAYNAGLSWVLPQIGELHEKAGAWRKAERIYRRCVRENASPEVALRGLVRVYENAGRCARAQALAMTKPKELVPTLAGARAERGDRDGAERLLRALVDSGHVDALLKLAQLRKGAGDLAGAETMLRRACDAGVFGARKALRELRGQRVA
ncbi:hypothetical protein ACWEVP_38155 [Amycolatopsis sp. NPDC003865]